MYSFYIIMNWLNGTHICTYISTIYDNDTIVYYNKITHQLRNNNINKRNFKIIITQKRCTFMQSDNVWPHKNNNNNTKKKPTSDPTVPNPIDVIYVVFCGVSNEHGLCLYSEEIAVQLKLITNKLWGSCDGMYLLPHLCITNITIS